MTVEQGTRMQLWGNRQHFEYQAYKTEVSQGRGYRRCVDRADEHAGLRTG